MIVVADASPINYLVQISEIDLLPRLYQTILIPQGVHVELLRDKAPPAVKQWAENLPSWCRVAHSGAIADKSLEGLHPGEREAIQLAINSGIDTILMDDLAGRIAADQLKLIVTGTASVLEEASARGWINFREAFARLLSTNFRLSDRVRDEFLRRNP